MYICSFIEIAGIRHPAGTVKMSFRLVILLI